MKKDKRTLKVCEQSGYRYKPTPALMLKGVYDQYVGDGPV